MNVIGLDQAAINLGDGEAHIRALMFQGLGSAKPHPRQLDSRNIEDSDRIEVAATVTSDQREGTVIEQIVGRLSLEGIVTAARWPVDALAE